MVLGDMGEVGDDGPNLHREVGTYAQAQNIEHLLCLGELSRHSAAVFAHGVHFDHLETLLHALDELAGRCGSILIKGSRFMRMERAVTHLQASAAPSPQERSAHVA